MIVWVYPCKSRSSPGSISKTLVGKLAGVFLCSKTWGHLSKEYAIMKNHNATFNDLELSILINGLNYLAQLHQSSSDENKSLFTYFYLLTKMDTKRIPILPVSESDLRCYSLFTKSNNNSRSNIKDSSQLLAPPNTPVLNHSSSSNHKP